MTELQEAPLETAEDQQQPLREEEAFAQEPVQQEGVEYAELVKSEVLNNYKANCEAAGLEPHEAFVAYLEETYDENDGIDLVI